MSKESKEEAESWYWSSSTTAAAGSGSGALGLAATGRRRRANSPAKEVARVLDLVAGAAAVSFFACWLSGRRMCFLGLSLLTPLLKLLCPRVLVPVGLSVVVVLVVVLVFFLSSSSQSQPPESHMLSTN